MFQCSTPQVSPARAAASGAQVLLDDENVQPTEAELRALVPEAGRLWVFHGPHQRQVGKQFASFGAAVSAVPISKTGKNAPDIQLSFHLGCIAWRNPASALGVVASDKGHEPLLEHARSMGFAARRVGLGRARTAASMQAVSATMPGAKKAPASKAAAKKVSARKAAARPPAVGPAPAKRAAMPPGPAATIDKLIDSLRKMGDQRPTKPVSLWRSLKSFLGAGATEEAVELALARLIEDGVVKVDSVKGASYPGFDAQGGSTAGQA
ncbi:MAG: hypothetical protein JNL87_10450 [Burkholderiaceae bacterium]|nr:hypothetical protein [Burkholderiaceae bacterium]